jgi:hypothetical protein
MSRRPQARSRGPGSATGAGGPDLRPWWSKESAPRPDRTVVTIPPAVEREATRLGTIALAAAGIQRAADEHELFAAVAGAIEQLGLSGHVATLDSAGRTLEIREVAMPAAHQAELERIHAGPMVGARIPVSSGSAHWTVVHQRCAMHAPKPLAWVLGADPGIGPTEADAIGAFVGIGEALLVPITDERDVFGVLTLWARTLTGFDRAAAEILGRLAGGALSSQGARRALWQEAPARAA